MTFKTDRYGANALGAQQEAMSGPLEPAMRSQALEIGAGGLITLDSGAWEPMIQIAPKRDLGEEELVINASIVGGAALLPLRFARFTEKGSWLVLHVPPINASRRTAAPVDVRLAGTLDGIALAELELLSLVDVRLVEGLFARLLQVLSAETRQVRRQVRLVHAAATLEGARGFMLDRYGQELSVPRLTDVLQMVGSELVTVPAAESDADFRRRLRIFRRWCAADRNSVLRELNGDATTAGPLQQIGAPSTFAVEEQDNPLFSALSVVSIAATAADAIAQRNNFFNYLRDTVLIDPVVPVPATRSLPFDVRTEEDNLRTRLRNGITFVAPTKRAMAPYLARAFDRLVSFIKDLGIVATVRVLRAQDATGGNRYELGLGADIGALPAVLLAQVRTALGQPLPAGASHESTTVAAALQGADVTGADGAWLLAACGFRTIDPVAGGGIFVSHLPMGRLVISGQTTASQAVAASGLKYTASIGSGAAGLGMALAHALGGGSAGWPMGDPPWTLMPTAQLEATLDALTVPDPQTAAAIHTSRVAVLAANDVQPFRQATKRYPEGTVAALSLTPAFATSLAANDAGTVARWGRLIETLGANGAASAALFGGPAAVQILLVSAHGLPEIGSNIGPRRSTGYYWNLMPASAHGTGQITPNGTEARLRRAGNGIHVIHCLASARVGETDPYEYRVTLPVGTSIDLGQYEMLMNILTRACPVGVEVNTWLLRRSHVRLAGATATPLTPNQSRAFRRWRKLHFAGVELNRPDFQS